MKVLLLLLLMFSGFAQEPPVRILVAYHSESGNTEKLARAVQRGAASVEGVEAVLRKTAEVKAGEFATFAGIVVGTPVHWSNTSAEVRRFMDVLGDALWKAKTNGDGRTAGVFCTGGGTAMGKDVARWSVLSAFLTMRFIVIGGVDDAGFGTLGPEATTGPADPGISPAEETEAVRFGERFARMTRQLRNGAAK
jgi:NAD(P)H dehydrogenase (quinone)